MKAGEKPLKVLVIPDTHSEPGVSGERFLWLGRMILAERPDAVVHLGDHWDFRSLGGYEKGKASGEGVRYSEELVKGREDLALITKPCRKAKKKLPQLLFLEGNHERRVAKYADAHPELKEYLTDLSWIKLAEGCGWKVYPFLRPVLLGGVAFAHYFVSGKMGAPSASASAALNRHHRSIVYGHGHCLDMAFNSSPISGISRALEAGVYCEQMMSYTGPQVHKLWWRGVHMLHDVHDGQYDLDSRSLDRMRRDYA